VKRIYLAISEASKKWTLPIQGWKQALNHFAILFEGRASGLRHGLAPRFVAGHTLSGLLTPRLCGIFSIIGEPGAGLAVCHHCQAAEER
jgi:hypothetical protein